MKGVVKEASARSLVVESPILWFRDRAERHTVVLAAAEDSNQEQFGHTLSPQSDRKSYFRVLWPLPDLKDVLSSMLPGMMAWMSLDFPGWEPLSQKPKWIGIVSMTPTRAGHSLITKIWQETEEATDFRRADRFSVAAGAFANDLFLCAHFDYLSEPLLIARPKLFEREEFDKIGVVQATIRERILNISGWAVNEKFPGIPVRLQLLVDNDLRAEYLAKSQEQPNNESVPPAGAFAFRMSCHISRLDEDSLIRICIKEGRSAVELQVDAILESSRLQSQHLQAGESPWSILNGDEEVIGKIERLTYRDIEGWALAPKNPNAAIDLVLYVGGVASAYTRTSRFRGDVQAAHGGNGFCGFRIELPPNLSLSKQNTWEVRPLVGSGVINHGSFVFGRPGRFIASSRQIGYPCGRKEGPYSSSPVTAVVLNRNCAALLDDLLRSAAKHEPLGSIEWIIVDHASTDASQDVCAKAEQRGQVVKFLKRNGNYSFSDSNNFGVRHATHETILFVNNDLVFKGPFVHAIQAALADADVGVVGVRLADYIGARNWYESDIIQHIGVFIKPILEARSIRPFESRISSELPTSNHLLEVPAVTGAMMAMRVSDFEKVGGWDLGYVYGLEDIDLCLRVKSNLNKKVVSEQGVLIQHHRGFSRNKESDVVVRQRNNNDRFNKRWGRVLRRMIRAATFGKPSFWTGARPTIAFIVVDHGDMTTCGEFYTALELGLALQKQLPCHIAFLKESEWYDLTGIDVLIVMVNKFDIRKVQNASPFLISINWMRQWFDRWSEDESIYAYDYLFASSQVACDFINERTGLNVALLRIAANVEHMERGNFVEAYASDYCLTANKVGTNREIELCLMPENIAGDGVVFGHNWETTRFHDLMRGPVPYSRIPDVYASTKIVIDDANIATKEWGSCNSRVFDAMAAGCLVVTNGKLGVDEAFRGLVPTFDSASSLTETLNYWLNNHQERENRVNALSAMVRSEHNYDLRAAAVLKHLADHGLPIRVAIKCAAKFKERHIWGDFHFANSLARSLRNFGFIVRVDCVESWNSPLADTDDVAIVLSGRGKYNPMPNQLNLLWIISHPGSVAINDIEPYDHVYVASRFHADALRSASAVPIEVMLQCSDTKLFALNSRNENVRCAPPIFVGNSRGIFRQAVRWTAELEADFELYGFGWEQFISDCRLKGINIPNDVLASFYQSARFVLCDHWDDMKRLGYLSNRAFDVLACGGHLVVDDVLGIEELLPGGYSVFRSKEELATIFSTELNSSPDEVRSRASWIQENHSFDARAKVFAQRIFDSISADSDVALAQ